MNNTKAPPQKPGREIKIAVKPFGPTTEQLAEIGSRRPCCTWPLHAPAWWPGRSRAVPSIAAGLPGATIGRTALRWPRKTNG